ncbi:prolipoprotein diacylglyceryl transferase [Aureisphaera galaxeae]|uniref:prolipoprotein diacylglyceryl transferase family protein n=1 Tax=Aureisphaera galaxeae TaxID=1538023 RepID=UPI0023508800|nr:prolipoprotein diacylglyceryl transferase family protein [Aureisphaera galaxeae]MDC8002952.1 prolipoprotein diacylglyceryl transferase [Aureisphaera galaxeae]
MELPFEPTFFGIHWNVHLILEYLAFLIAFRYYVYLRKNSNDPISYTNRLSIILGAIFGALVGSRVVGWLEYPFIDFSENVWLVLLNTKTIMGGLFGGLLGVEIAKKIIGETQSSGDLFTFPIILGIFIGRIGCFLSGTNEFTYGTVTNSFLGMDLGDGLLRHPLALYELLFLAFLFVFLKRIQAKVPLKSGKIFAFFMIAYFAFRFFIEFLKPNEFLLLGLSSIQYLCIVCLIYYRKTILSIKS